jgi:hypothetical protein
MRRLEKSIFAALWVSAFYVVYRGYTLPRSLHVSTTYVGTEGASSVVTELYWSGDGGVATQLSVNSQGVQHTHAWTGGWRWRRSGAKQGTAKGLPYRVILRYTVCAGLINQHYAHIAALLLAEQLGAEVRLECTSLVSLLAPAAIAAPLLVIHAPIFCKLPCQPHAHPPPSTTRPSPRRSSSRRPATAPPLASDSA